MLEALVTENLAFVWEIRVSWTDPICSAYPVYKSGSERLSFRSFGKLGAIQYAVQVLTNLVFVREKLCSQAYSADPFEACYHHLLAILRARWLFMSPTRLV